MAHRISAIKCVAVLLIEQFAMSRTRTRTGICDMTSLTIGDQCATGQIVAEILGQSSKVCVYITDDKHLRWQYHGNNGDIPDYLSPAVSAFDTLMLEIRQSMPAHQQNDAYKRLGKALFSALKLSEADAETSLLNCFEPVRSLIKNAALQIARFQYTLTAITFAIILVIVLTALANTVLIEHLPLVVGAILGSGGAAVSVMQRSAEVDINPKQSPPALVLQGAIRVILGAIFGVLFVLASKANLVMGSLNENIYGLSVFAFIAGFSERFMPEILENLAASASGDTKS